MIDYELDKASRIVRVRPESPLDKNDFAELAKAVDPEINAGGDLAGLILDAPHFPGVGQLRGAGDPHAIRARSPCARQEDRRRHRLAHRRFR